MFLKDNLAAKLLGKSLSLTDLQSLAKHPNYPNFEVRTVGSKGEVQIKFPNQGWVKPDEWAINHRNTIVNNLNSAIERTSQLTDLEEVLNAHGFASYDQASSIISETIETKSQELENHYKDLLNKKFQAGIKVGERDKVDYYDVIRLIESIDEEFHRKLANGEDVTVGSITRAIIDGIDEMRN